MADRYPFQFIRTELDDDGILTVTLDRPDRRNSISPEMHEEFAPLFGRIATDRAVKVVVLTGAGTKAFCVGADFGGMEENLEAGMALEGWEVKSLRAGKAQITEGYVLLKNGEAWLIGAHFSPLKTVSTHIVADPTRTRKLLLHRREIDRLVGAVERKGYTIVPLRLYWKQGRVKLEVGLAKGKQAHDKRATEKNRDWQREKARLMRGR